MNSLASLNRKSWSIAEEVEYLKGRVAQLERALGLYDSECVFPAEWRLCKTDIRILNTLIRRETVRKADLYEAIYWDKYRASDTPDIKTIDVFIWRLRQKLRPFGIIIITRHCIGISLELTMRRQLFAEYGHDNSVT